MEPLKGHGDGKKYEIGWIIIFQCYCNFSQFSGESLRSLAKRLWWKYCNIRWDEQLYFNAFASNCRVSLEKVIVLRSHTESFEGKCKVSWGTQCFCESAWKVLRANAKFFRGTQYFFERTWNVLGVNAKFVSEHQSIEIWFIYVLSIFP